MAGKNFSPLFLGAFFLFGLCNAKTEVEIQNDLKETIAVACKYDLGSFTTYSLKPGQNVKFTTIGKGVSASCSYSGTEEPSKIYVLTGFNAIKHSRKYGTLIKKEECLGKFKIEPGNNYELNVLDIIK